MLIDELMPQHDVAARYQTLVKAAPERTFAIVQHLDFSQSRVIRLLMGIRTLGRSPRPDAKLSLTERMQKAGFMEVARRENEEIVIGIVGRFWQPRGGVILGLSPKEILDFHTEGYAKALWNFHHDATSSHQTQLSTETRVQIFGSAARRRFRLYWSVVGPFSGWIRKEMLRLIRTQAEQSDGDRR